MDQNQDDIGTSKENKLYKAQAKADILFEHLFGIILTKKEEQWSVKCKGLGRSRCTVTCLHYLLALLCTLGTFSEVKFISSHIFFLQLRCHV